MGCWEFCGGLTCKKTPTNVVRRIATHICPFVVDSRSRMAEPGQADPEHRANHTPCPMATRAGLKCGWHWHLVRPHIIRCWGCTELMRSRTRTQPRMLQNSVRQRRSRARVLQATANRRRANSTRLHHPMRTGDRPATRTNIFSVRKTESNWATDFSVDAGRTIEVATDARVWFKYLTTVEQPMMQYPRYSTVQPCVENRLFWQSRLAEADASELRVLLSGGRGRRTASCVLEISSCVAAVN